MSYSPNNKTKFFWILIAIITNVLYLMVSINNALHTNIIGDTYQYMVVFQNIIHNDLFPFRIEFITSTLMWLVSSIGGDFYTFLFICYALWCPVIFLLVVKSRNNIFIIPIILFFFTPLFASNVTFLIRQYNAAFFFIMYLYCLNSNKKQLITVTFIFLSICSHLSAIIWLFLLNKKLAKIIYKPLIFIILFLISLSFLLLHINIISSFIECLATIANYLNLEVINRKIAFYISGEFSQALAVNFKFIIIMLVLMIFCIFWSFRIKKQKTQLFLGLVFMQAFTVTLLQANIVMANRFGFFAYYFAIPLLILVITHGFKKIRIGLK